MKKILILLLVISSFARAQEYVEQIKQLENSKTQISEKIILLNDSINKIDLKINALKSKDFQKLITDSSLVAVAKKNAKIKKIPDVMGEIILTLEEDKKVIILDYHNEFFGVCVDSICGYMSDTWIVDNENTREYVKIKKRQYAEIEQRKDDLKLKQEDIEYAKTEKANLKKYGKVVYEKLKK
jgi:hypothetical protein